MSEYSKKTDNITW